MAKIGAPPKQLNLQIYLSIWIVDYDSSSTGTKGVYVRWSVLFLHAQIAALANLSAAVLTAQ